MHLKLIVLAVIAYILLMRWSILYDKSRSSGICKKNAVKV